MTVSTKHTAGPWESQATAGHDIHGQSSVYSECDGKDIAIVYDGEANARLIAAAPELLEALREIQDHLYTKQDFARCREMARAAIAKAKGRDQTTTGLE